MQGILQGIVPPAAPTDAEARRRGTRKRRGDKRTHLCFQRSPSLVTHIWLLPPHTCRIAHTPILEHLGPHLCERLHAQLGPALHLLLCDCAQVASCRHLEGACARHHCRRAGAERRGCGTEGQAVQCAVAGGALLPAPGTIASRQAGSRATLLQRSRARSGAGGARQHRGTVRRTTLCSRIHPPAASSIVFFTARSPSRTASLICGQAGGGARWMDAQCRGGCGSVEQAAWEGGRAVDLATGHLRAAAAAPATPPPPAPAPSFLPAFCPAMPPPPPPPPPPTHPPPHTHHHHPTCAIV